MSESVTNHFLRQEKKNEDYSYDTNFDSSEYHPDQFGVGIVTGKMFEEIYDEEDEWESFFTYMFFIGIILIPLQLIFADILKPYDAMLIETIQGVLFSSEVYRTYISEPLLYLLVFISNVRIQMSLAIFFYLSFEPGIAYKTSIVAGFGSYLVFILKLIIHDARPYWVHPEVIPGICRMSWGSPSLDLFVGMIYSHYFFFCIDRALRSKDPIIKKNFSAIQTSMYIAVGLIVLNISIGICYFCLGENYIYQILITFFYGFILIRIMIVFNKEVDHFSNGSRYMIEISNLTTITMIFVVSLLAIISSIIYAIVNQDLLVPREWSANINNKCANTFQSTVTTVKLTFLDSSAIFYVLGATIGVNFILRNIDNPFYWFVTSWYKRIIRGVIGFFLNFFLLSLTKSINFRAVTSDYFIDAFLFGSSGFISFGCLPVIFSYIGLTDHTYRHKKEQKENEDRLLVDLNNLNYYSDKIDEVDNDGL